MEVENDLQDEESPSELEDSSSPFTLDVSLLLLVVTLTGIPSLS